MIKGRTKKIMDAVQLGGSGTGNGRLNGLKKYALWMTVIIASMAAGGYVFDLVSNIISQDMRVRQNETRIAENSKQLEIIKKETFDRKLEDIQFKATMKKTIEEMGQSLKTLQHIVWKLDKKMAVIETIDANVKKLANEEEAK